MVIETLTVPKAENGCLWNIGLCLWSGFVSVPERRLVFHEDLYTSILLGAINIPLSNCIVPINSLTVYIVSTAASRVKV